MKLIHVLKSGKINEIPLTDIKASTRHVISKGVVRHEGWTVGGLVDEKGHQYYLMFDAEEAQQHAEWLEKMLPRFASEELDSHIHEENQNE